MTYQECRIYPCPSGFGEYQCSECNGVDWEDSDGLRDAMAEGVAEAGGEMIELGAEPLPGWAEDIRGRIHCEPGRVFAARYPACDRDDVYYYGIVSRDDGAV